MRFVIGFVRAVRLRGEPIVFGRIFVEYIVGGGRTNMFVPFFAALGSWTFFGGIVASAATPSPTPAPRTFLLVVAVLAIAPGRLGIVIVRSVIVRSAVVRSAVVRSAIVRSVLFEVGGFRGSVSVRLVGNAVGIRCAGELIGRVEFFIRRPASARIAIIFSSAAATAASPAPAAVRLVALGWPVFAGCLRVLAR